MTEILINTVRVSVACVACEQEWHDLESLDDLCAWHMNNLIVTVCKVCQQPALAEKAGICPDCDREIAEELDALERT